jgi:hypothetical protein
MQLFTVDGLDDTFVGPRSEDDDYDLTYLVYEYYAALFG